MTSIRFYKGTTSTGPYIVNLWSGDGAERLATGTLTSSATGWVQVDFATPVVITTGTDYVASYHVPPGAGYAFNADYFGPTPYSRGQLMVVNAVDTGGGNLGAGSFTYSDGSVFPTSTSTSNYWVSPVFVETAQNPPPPLPANMAPTVGNQSASVTEDGSLAVALSATDDNTALSAMKFTILSLPTLGLLTYNGVAVSAGQTFTGSPSNLVYTPGVETEGGLSDAFTYTATDDDPTPLTARRRRSRLR